MVSKTGLAELLKLLEWNTESSWVVCFILIISSDYTFWSCQQIKGREIWVTGGWIMRRPLNDLHESSTCQCGIAQWSLVVMFVIWECNGAQESCHNTHREDQRSQRKFYREAWSLQVCMCMYVVSVRNIVVTWGNVTTWTIHGIQWLKYWECKSNHHRRRREWKSFHVYVLIKQPSLNS